MIALLIKMKMMSLMNNQIKLFNNEDLINKMIDIIYIYL